MGNPTNAARRLLLVSIGVTILTSTSIAPAGAISINLKKSPSNFDLPTADALDGDTAGDAGNASADLAPLSLTETKAAPATTEAAAKPADKQDGTLNASITTNTFVPKGPLEGDNGLLAPTSVKGSKTKDIAHLGSGSLLEQAKSVNAAPLPLIDSAADSERKADETAEAEREQLTSLWEATLARSPDINFVLQKLMPNSDPSKVTTVLMRTLAMAINTGIAGATMVAPNTGTYMAGNAAMSTMSQLLGIAEGSNAKKAKITQTEQIMLYNMIRNTADKLVEKYRTYKDKHKSLYKANADMEELKSLAPEAKKDGAKEMEIVYTLKRQQRDIDEIGSQLSKARQDLADLAGQDEIAKLDTAIDEEFKRLHPELNVEQVNQTQPSEGAQVAGSPSSGSFKLPGTL